MNSSTAMQSFRWNKIPV